MNVFLRKSSFQLSAKRNLHLLWFCFVGNFFSKGEEKAVNNESINQQRASIKQYIKYQ